MWVIDYMWKRYLGLSKRKKEKDAIIKSFEEGDTTSSIKWNLIEIDWNISSKNISQHDKIDDITWNDLEMDQLYCKMNNCKSFTGDQILYSTLHKSGNGNTLFQKKIDFFTSNSSDRYEIWYIISRLGKKEDSYYLPAFISNMDAFKIPHIEYYRLMRALLFLSVIPAIVYLNYIYLMFTLFVGVINIVIYTFQKNRYEAYLNMLSGVLGIMQTAKQIAGTPSLDYEKEFHDLNDKVVIFKKLYSKIRKLQFRAPSNLYGDTMTLLESFTFGATLWDLIQYDKVMNQLIGHQKYLMALYKTIGEIDAAICIASFRNRMPLHCTPEFSENNEIIAEDIYHPLVLNPIYNSISIKKGCMITGSNASGKSTFIKALAVNTLLAQSIYTCMAKKMVIPRMTIITSMAVRDEVLSGESYYIKEIKYMKRIIQALNERKPVLCVIDEILRGTNTAERIAASVAILEYLYEKNCIAVVATHDIELTGLLKDYYENYHFTEYIEDKKIVFEYKLHTGPATSRNAIRLLEYMDFPEQIIKKARTMT